MLIIGVLNISKQHSWTDKCLSSCLTMSHIVARFYKKEKIMTQSHVYRINVTPKTSKWNLSLIFLSMICFQVENVRLLLGLCSRKQNHSLCLLPAVFFLHKTLNPIQLWHTASSVNNYQVSPCLLSTFLWGNCALSTPR